ncbi:MAG TPA: hypothetical protein VHE61_21070 [Opitutaceae bacterium]|nr:hypothetical protein [Opitutaceae bacterium]
MKTSNLLLGASLVVNVALIGIIAAGMALGPGGTSASDAGKPPTPAPAVTSAPAPDSGAWLALNSTDLAVERDRLRAQGFPDRLVRAILAAQIQERYAAQRKAIVGNTDVPFWKQPKADPKIAAALRQLAQAERQELRALVGNAPNDGRTEMLTRAIPNLSADKAEQLADIMTRYDQTRQDIFSGGMLTPAEREKLQSLDKEMHAEFASVLTPEELEQYDLRASRTAMQMQNSLAAFNPTEQEFRAIYKLQSAFDDQYSMMYGGASQDEMKARMEAQKQLQSDLAAALGPDRYADYQRSTDYNYQAAARLVARLQMPPETADNLYALQKEYQQKSQDIMRAARASGPTDMQGMIQQLTTLQQEAASRVSATFNGNPEAVAAYKTYGGQWLQNMVPRMSHGPGFRHP